MALPIPLIAAGLSAGGSILSSLLQKKPKVKTEQISRFSPEQQKLFRQITSQLTPEMIQQLYGPIDRDTLRQRFETTTAEPARQAFSEELVPELQELFAGMGIGGGDAPQYQLASAGRRLESDLARQFAGLQQSEEANRRNAITSLLGAQAVTPQQTISGGQDLSGIGSQLGGIGGDIFSRWLQNNLFGGGATSNQTVGSNAFIPFSTSSQLPEFDPMYGFRKQVI